MIFWNWQTQCCRLWSAGHNRLDLFNQYYHYFLNINSTQILNNSLILGLYFDAQFDYFQQFLEELWFFEIGRLNTVARGAPVTIVSTYSINIAIIFSI